MEIIEYAKGKLGDRYSEQAYARLLSAFWNMGVYTDDDLGKSKFALSDYQERCKAMGGVQLNMLRELGVPGKVNSFLEAEMDKCRMGDVRSLRKVIKDMWNHGDFSHWGAWCDYNLEEELTRLGFEINREAGAVIIDG